MTDDCLKTTLRDKRIPTVKYTISKSVYLTFFFLDQDSRLKNELKNEIPLTVDCPKTIMRDKIIPTVSSILTS